MKIQSMKMENFVKHMSICCLIVVRCTIWYQGLSQDLITGGQFVPLAKIVGDIFIFRGTVSFLTMYVQTKKQASQQKHFIYTCYL